MFSSSFFKINLKIQLKISKRNCFFHMMCKDNIFLKIISNQGSISFDIKEKITIFAMFFLTGKML